MPGIAAFLAGVALLQLPAVLPAPGWAAGAVLLPWFLRRPFLRPVAWFLGGACWALAHAHLVRPADLPFDLPDRTVTAEGVVEGLPRCTAHRCSFFFTVHRLQEGSRVWQGRWRLRLSARTLPSAPEPGERWRFPLRLKPVVGYRNPGGFDHAGWLHARGVRYRARVTGEAVRLSSAGSGLDRLRLKIARGLEAGGGDGAGTALMKALAVGDRSGLSAGQRAALAATGTSHLVAISGLHVGLVAGLAWGVVAWLWRRAPMLCARWPARVAAAPAAFAAAVGYAALAGFALPTLRALVMLSVVLLALVLRRHAPPWRVLGTALVLVVAADPAAVREAGLWLSFGAVTLIYGVAARTRRPGLWLQPALSFGLMPVLAWHGMPLSWISPLVNLAAVPLFGLVAVPGTLLVTGMEWLLDWPGTPLLHGLAQLLGLFLELAERAAEWNPGFLPDGLAWMAGLGTVAVLAPSSWRRRFLPAGLLGLLLATAGVGRGPAPGGFELTLLDVGQGLSAVVRTRHHLLVYDTGPRFSSGFDTGRAVLLPYLRSLGTGRVDRLVLSHGDSDHAGGAASLLAALPVESVMAGEPDAAPPGSRPLPCRAGDRWWWDGVEFRVLWPPSGAGREGNDASCVLRIRAGSHAVLLTGDLEGAGEKALVAREGGMLRSTVVVAAHHGSASSSTPPFVAATRPRLVLFSAGFLNRWDFPRQEVLERWCRAGARPLVTAAEGGIRVEVTSGGARILERHARDRRRWWWHPVRQQLPGACSMIGP